MLAPTALMHSSPFDFSGLARTPQQQQQTYFLSSPSPSPSPTAEAMMEGAPSIGHMPADYSQQAHPLLTHTAMPGMRTRSNTGAALPPPIHISSGREESAPTAAATSSSSAFTVTPSPMVSFTPAPPSSSSPTAGSAPPPSDMSAVWSILSRHPPLNIAARQHIKLLDVVMERTCQLLTQDPRFPPAVLQQQLHQIGEHFCSTGIRVVYLFVKRAMQEEEMASAAAAGTTTLVRRETDLLYDERRATGAIAAGQPRKKAKLSSSSISSIGTSPTSIAQFDSNRRADDDDSDSDDDEDDDDSDGGSAGRNSEEEDEDELEPACKKLRTESGSSRSSLASSKQRVKGESEIRVKREPGLKVEEGASSGGRMSSQPQRKCASKQSTVLGSKRKSKGGESEFSPAAVSILRRWLQAHLDDPYPDASTKESLAEVTRLTYDQVRHTHSQRTSERKERGRERGESKMNVDRSCSHFPFPFFSADSFFSIPSSFFFLTSSQVQHWFINARMRYWRPLLRSQQALLASGVKLEDLAADGDGLTPPLLRLAVRPVERGRVRRLDLRLHSRRADESQLLLAAAQRHGAQVGTQLYVPRRHGRRAEDQQRRGEDADARQSAQRRLLRLQRERWLCFLRL